MDAAECCRLQSTECRRLMELAQSEVEVKALRNLVRSWTLIANQTDQYAEIMQKPLTDEGIAKGRSGANPKKQARCVAMLRP
jgi:hypothetical protein